MQGEKKPQSSKPQRWKDKYNTKQRNPKKIESKIKIPMLLAEYFLPNIFRKPLFSRASFRICGSPYTLLALSPCSVHQPSDCGCHQVKTYPLSCWQMVNIISILLIDGCRVQNKIFTGMLNLMFLVLCSGRSLLSPQVILTHD